MFSVFFLRFLGMSSSAGEAPLKEFKNHENVQQFALLWQEFLLIYLLFPDDYALNLLKNMPANWAKSVYGVEEERALKQTMLDDSSRCGWGWHTDQGILSGAAVAEVFCYSKRAYNSLVQLFTGYLEQCWRKEAAHDHPERWCAVVREFKEQLNVPSDSSPSSVMMQVSVLRFLNVHAQLWSWSPIFPLSSPMRIPSV